ncbi:MAG: Na+/H+ antiporter NhaA [Dehalococcoidia bacterium]
MAQDPAPLRSRALPRLVRPLQEFLSTETLGGVLLLAAAAVALAWVNIASDSYTDFWGRHASIDLPGLRIEESLREWVNDGLMAVFFFVVGLEIKRELLEGELADRRRATLPAVAALGGMVVPACIYLAFNAGESGSRGWGIPMATDIAFAVGVLALLGRRVPLALKVFLLALAIVDDLGAIAVIAIFYTEELSYGWLAAAAGLFALTAAFSRLGVRNVLVYAAVGVVAWVAVLESGVHATIAGVVMGLLTPTRPHIEGSEESVLGRLEHTLHPWTSFGVIPVFALANAGVELGGDAIADAVRSRVTVGVLLGLAVGKPAGILLFSWLAVRAGLAALPARTGWAQVAAASMIAGIGFTVSLFIAELAFSDAALVDDAKIGIFAGSALIGAAGFVLMRLLPLQTGGDAGGEVGLADEASSGT